LAKLAAHGHRLSGYCLDCAATYRKELLPLIERPALFSVDMSVVIADRGASADVPGKRCIRCPTYAGRETEIHVTAPSKGGPRR
jgi:hypothetical protein